MELDFKSDGNSVLVRLDGELDEYASRFLRPKVDKLIESAAMRELILDMQRVTFVDSTGLGFVLGRYKKLRERHAELLLKNVPPQVDKVFAASGVYNFVPKLD